MSETQIALQDFIKTISDKYPLIGLGISLTLGTIGTFFPSILGKLSEVEIPNVIMQLGQWLFWTLGSAVSIIVALPAIKKNLIDKIKSKRNKNN